MNAKNAKPIVLIMLVVVAMIAIGAAVVYRGGANWGQQYHTNQSLWQAVENGDVAAAQKALALGADPNEAGDAGLSEHHTLITALSHNDLKMVTVLLAHKADPSRALTLAVNEKEAARLLQLGAQVNGIVDGTGMTILGEQSANGRPDIVHLLLVHGAAPNERDQDGETALDRARYAASKHPEEAAAHSVILKMLQNAQKSGQRR